MTNNVNATKATAYNGLFDDTIASVAKATYCTADTYVSHTELNNALNSAMKKFEEPEVRPKLLQSLISKTARYMLSATRMVFLMARIFLSQILQTSRYIITL